MENERNFFNNKEELRLREGIPRIQVEEGDYLEDEDSPEVLWVDYDYGEDEEKEIISAGLDSYVISPVDEQNKFSDKYLNCIGTVGFGRDKTSGKEISFISHQDPEYFLNKGDNETNKFISDIETALKELISKSQDDSIEVGLFGGNDDLDDPNSKKSVDYKKSIEMLNKVIKDTVGIKPVMLSEPNHGEGAIDVTVLTQERKIFIGGR